MLSALVGAKITGVSLSPWQEFEAAIQAVNNAKAQQRPTGNPEFDKSESIALSKLVALAKRYDSASWKAAYCVAFYGLLVSSNAISFFLSVALSRLILQEIVLSGRIFGAIS